VRQAARPSENWLNAVAIGPEDIVKLAALRRERKIDLTVVGPELPLTLGITDLFESRGLRIFGPNKTAAQLEGSKAFAKEILRQNSIPTASFGTFTDAALARNIQAKSENPLARRRPSALDHIWAFILREIFSS